MSLSSGKKSPQSGKVSPQSSKVSPQSSKVSPPPMMMPMAQQPAFHIGSPQPVEFLGQQPMFRSVSPLFEPTYLRGKIWFSG